MLSLVQLQETSKVKNKEEITLPAFVTVFPFQEVEKESSNNLKNVWYSADLFFCGQMKVAGQFVSVLKVKGQQF